MKTRKMSIQWTPLSVTIESQKDGEYADASLTVVVSTSEAAALLRTARADQEVFMILESRKRGGA